MSNREPTDGEVERAAKACWERTHEHMPWFAPAGDQARREAFRDQARVMLRAAHETKGTK